MHHEDRQNQIQHPRRPTPLERRLIRYPEKPPNEGAERPAALGDGVSLDPQERQNPSRPIAAHLPHVLLLLVVRHNYLTPLENFFSLPCRANISCPAITRTREANEIHRATARLRRGY